MYIEKEMGNFFKVKELKWDKYRKDSYECYKIDNFYCYIDI